MEGNIRMHSDHTEEKAEDQKIAVTVNMQIFLYIWGKKYLISFYLLYFIFVEYMGGKKAQGNVE